MVTLLARALIFGRVSMTYIVFEFSLVNKMS